MLELLIELWVSFWLWIAGGTASAAMWMIFASALIAVPFMVLPILFLTKEQNGEDGDAVDRGWRWHYPFLIFGAIATMIGSFMIAGALGIVGVSQYNSYFYECVQTYDVANIREDIDAITVHTLHCREREHIDDEWGAYSVVEVQQQPWLNVELVEFID